MLLAASTRMSMPIRSRTSASLIENLRQVKGKGLTPFLREQEARYRCPTYGGVLCIHDGICYDYYIKQHPA